MNTDTDTHKTQRTDTDELRAAAQRIENQAPGSPDAVTALLADIAISLDTVADVLDDYHTNPDLDQEDLYARLHAARHGGGSR